MCKPGDACAATVKPPLKLIDEDSLPGDRTFHDDRIELGRPRVVGNANPLADEASNVERLVDAAGGRTVNSDDSYHLAAGALAIQNLSGDLPGDSAVDSPRAPAKHRQDKSLEHRPSGVTHELQKRPEPRLENAAPGELFWAGHLDDAELAFLTGLDDLVDGAGPASAALIPRVFVEQTVRQEDDFATSQIVKSGRGAP
jgi:hypothetical protein